MSGKHAVKWLPLAICLGWLAGYGEVFYLGLQKYYLHQPIYFGPQFVWMVPLANLCVFVLLGLLLKLLARRWERLNSITAASSVLLFFTLLSWTLLFPRLNFYAGALLAAGCAWRAASLLKTRAERLQELANDGAQWLSVSWLLLCLSTLGWQQVSAKSVAAQNASKTPNVLLLVLDTVRAQNLSLYGYARPTAPRLTAFAQTGARFDLAIATAPWTLPSHAGMFTGRFPHELSADFRTPLDAAAPTLAEALQARGYATAGFVANTYFCNAENGLARGFAHYEDFGVVGGEWLLNASLSRALILRDTVRRLVGYHDVVARKSAAEINHAFLHWLDGQSAQPFFAFLNYVDAHEPCLPPEPYAERFGPPVEHRRFQSTHLLRTSWRLHRERATAQQNRADVACYDGAIAYLDQQLGQLLDELRRRGQLGNTLVIITADHGEEFGEHGHYGHVDSAYLTQLHVPLVIALPGVIPAGPVVREPVSLRDLPATVMDTLKLSASFPGASLARYWREPGRKEGTPLLSELNVAPILVRQYAAGSKAVISSLVSGRYHYLKHPDGREELYDFADDPAEAHDLIGSDSNSALLAIFRQYLGYQTIQESKTNAD